jgi:hypothetical protein
MSLADNERGKLDELIAAEHRRIPKCVHHCWAIVRACVLECGRALPASIPRFSQQRACFLHSSTPDFHHLIVAALVKTAVVAVFEILPQ